MKPSWCFILLLVVSNSGAHVGACEMLTLPPVSPIPGLVLFVGQVRQQVTPQAIPGVTQPSPGILIQLAASGSGLDPGATVEVIPLGVDSACEPTPWAPPDLSDRYPTGSLVSVVGRFLGDDSPDSGARRRVVIWPSDFGGLGRIPDQVDRIPIGCLDFETFRSTYEENPYATWSLDVAWRNTQRGWFEDFEFLSCITTIETVINPSEREVALGKMAFYSRYDSVNKKVSRGLYSNLVKRAQLAWSAKGRLKKQFAAIHDAR